MMVFRDYLRINKQAFDKYAKIKQYAASISEQQRETYVKIKDPIIETLIKDALKHHGF